MAKKYYGIFEIAAINCAEEEEICQEFDVLETPVLMGYKSDSNTGVKYGEDEDIFLGNQTLGKMAMFAVNLMDDFVSIVTDSNYLEFANKNPSKLKMCLFTDKTVTPALFKTLSKEFRNSVDFGLVKKSSTEVVANFKIDKFPQVMLLKSIHDFTGTFMEEQINKDKIVDFIRKNVEKVSSSLSASKMSGVRFLNQENYASGFCGPSDKVICVLLVAKNGSEYSETMDSIKTNFESDNMNFFITDRSSLDLSRVIEVDTASDTEFQNDEYVEMMIIKGARKRYSYYKGSGDEDSLKNYIDMGMSQQFKKLVEPLEDAFVFAADTDL